jgi:hypothetical protein
VSETGAAEGKKWSYRFSQPGGVEIETGEFESDEAAETYAHELSRSRDVPVIVHRLKGRVDWEYLTEADARP